MKEKMISSLIYDGLGFPVKLTHVPMKQMLGEWVLDINLNKLQEEALKLLVHKEQPLQGNELRFIRKYFEMTTTAFGNMLGVTHAAVLKWEKGNLPSPAIDIYIRMFVLDQLKQRNEEFGRLYHQISLASLAKFHGVKHLRRKTLTMDASSRALSLRK